VVFKGKTARKSRHFNGKIVVSDGKIVEFNKLKLTKNSRQQRIFANPSGLTKMLALGVIKDEIRSGLELQPKGTKLNTPPFWENSRRLTNFLK
jgi:hypothetical protein